MAGNKRSSPQDASAPAKRQKIPETAAASRPRRNNPNTTTPKEKEAEQTNDAGSQKQKKPKGTTSKEAKATVNSGVKQKVTKSETKSLGDNPELKSGQQFWLMKAEPESRIEKGIDVKFSIHDLEERTEPEPWDGVRNYVARNNMRAMTKGDLAFFYHSNCKTPGIVGIMEVVRKHSPDESALDPKHPYYDPKENKENPKWSVVHVKHRLTLDKMISLKELQQYSKEDETLVNMQLLKMSRLSVSKVSPEEWAFVVDKAGVDVSKL